MRFHYDCEFIEDGSTDGHPVELYGNADSAGNVLTRVPRTTPDGLVVNNVYPQRQSTEDNQLDGTIHQRAVVPPAVQDPKISAG